MFILRYFTHLLAILGKIKTFTLKNIGTEIVTIKL